MKYPTSARSLASLLIVLCLLAAPLTAFAKKGEKNYKRGLEYESAQQWERAAQEFALAVASSPSDTEYQLHYRRAIFNASQKFMEQGRTLAEQGDYAGAYNAFRQAYGYDPVNDLAASEMERVLRLQREREGAGGKGATKGNTAGTNQGVPTVPTVYQPDANGASSAPSRLASAQPQEPPAPTAPFPRTEQLRTAIYNGELESYVRSLASELNLNVIFDRDFPKRTININLRDVTTAKVLDYLFISQGLFFQKLDRRTILVADLTKRPQYQQLVLRTFYISNADLNEVRTLIQTALPANTGRTAQVAINKTTNSITVRDTAENIRLIGQLLDSVDKDRAEVVMDVNIYEVSRSNLFQLGNQIGDQNGLTNLGGTSSGVVSQGNRSAITRLLSNPPPTALGAAFLIPSSTISAFQSKQNARLLASTQVHAFDSEQSTTRIGQKVPVQTAQVSNFGFNNTTPNQNAGTIGGVFNGGGFPVIQYQDVGLTLKFTPQVFPNLDVQVKMEIESNDIAGGQTLTPVFSQRQVSGTARIPNNRTMMIASIAQDKNSNGRRGLPLLGLVPVLGRLFSTPTREDSQSDIVITVAPRVLRAPTVTPTDLEPHVSGTVSQPANESLEAMLQQADREDQLAAARTLPTNVALQLPAPTTTAANAQTRDPESPAFVPAPKLLTSGMDAANAKSAALSAQTIIPASALVASGQVRDANTPIVSASNVTPAPAIGQAKMIAAPASVPAINGAELYVVSGQPEMKVGEKQRLMLLVKTGAPLGLAAATLRFDPRIFAVRSVVKGNLFGEAQAAPTITQSIDPKGSLLALIAPANGAPISGMGVLLFVEVEALAAGESDFDFESGGVHLMSADGRKLATQLKSIHLTVKR